MELSLLVAQNVQFSNLDTALERALKCGTVLGNLGRLISMKLFVFLVDINTGTGLKLCTIISDSCLEEGKVLCLCFEDIHGGGETDIQALLFYFLR